jgi:predicted nucleic acid-binding protein
MVYILDCSFCAALFLPHEKSGMVKDVFHKIAEEDEVFIPVLFWHEMAAVLNAAVSRNHLKLSGALDINQLLLCYNFSTDTQYGGEYTEKLLELSQLYKISANNAAYLELGMRKKGVVGTLNKELHNACIKAGLKAI